MPDPVDHRIQGVKDLLAKHAPQHRTPKYRVAADNHDLRKHDLEHRHRDGDRNENPEIAAGVKAKDRAAPGIAGVRVMDAKSGNHEKGDDGGRSPHDGAERPGNQIKTAVLSRQAEKRKYACVSDRDPERKHAAQGVYDVESLQV